jgi:hypothetical protein
LSLLNEKSTASGQSLLRPGSIVGVAWLLRAGVSRASETYMMEARLSAVNRGEARSSAWQKVKQALRQSSVSLFRLRLIGQSLKRISGATSLQIWGDSIGMIFHPVGIR